MQQEEVRNAVLDVADRTDRAGALAVVLEAYVADGATFTPAVVAQVAAAIKDVLESVTDELLELGESLAGEDVPPVPPVPAARKRR